MVFIPFEIYSTPKVLEQQGHFFCFCNTLNTFGVEINTRQEFQNFSFYFLVFKLQCVKLLRTRHLWYQTTQFVCEQKYWNREYFTPSRRCNIWQPSPICRAFITPEMSITKTWKNGLNEAGHLYHLQCSIYY